MGDWNNFGFLLSCCPHHVDSRSKVFPMMFAKVSNPIMWTKHIDVSPNLPLACVFAVDHRGSDADGFRQQNVLTIFGVEVPAAVARVVAM